MKGVTMKISVTILVLVLAILLPALAVAQVSGGTGKVGYQVRNYGVVRMFVPVATAGVRQFDRLTPVAGLDSANVFDYQNDANMVESPSLTIGGVADTVATTLSDNTGTNLPPNIQVRTTVYSWHGDSFFLVRFTYKNVDTTSLTYPLYLGGFIVPKPDNAYGGETMAYDTTKKVGYFHRAGGTAYIGFKVVSGVPYSWHSRDWDVYSSDPNSDVATDSMRWQMTAKPGFDTSLVAGSDGGAININSGLATLAPGQYASVYIAVIYAESLSVLRLQADSAQIRYNNTVFTDVRQTSRAVPEAFSIAQNYPNPFNPATRIAFQMKNAAYATLKVYNVLGQQVAVLLSEQLAPGSYSVEFNGANMPSGVYFYKLTAGNYVQTRRMALIR
jgi:hypothetical protein